MAQRAFVSTGAFFAEACGISTTIPKRAGSAIRKSAVPGPVSRIKNRSLSRRAEHDGLSLHRRQTEQAEALGEAPEDPLLLFSVLYGTYVANLLAFNGDACRDVAARFLGAR